MKAIHVIRREYTENVRKKSFIVATILVPIIMLGFLIVPLLFTLVETDEQLRVRVLDGVGGITAPFDAAVTDTLEDGRLRYLVEGIEVERDELEASRAALQEALLANRLDVLLVIPESVLDDGRVDYVTRDKRRIQVLEDFEDALTAVVMKRRLAAEGIDYDRVSELTTRVNLDIQQIRKTGEVESKSVLAEWGIVFIFVMILYSSLLTWGMAISRGIIEEKGSRIVEVLLSSIRPAELLFGKIVGLGLAGLTQLAIWGTVGLLISVYSASAAIEMLDQVNVPLIVFAYLLIYYLLGFLLYASIFTVIGSICSTEQDAQQLQGVVTLPMIIPILVLFMIVESPNGALAAVLSQIPLFSPMVMVARIILSEPAWWEIALSIALLLAAIWGAVVFSARIFRVGILMYGKRPSLPEVIRWYRRAG